MSVSILYILYITYITIYISCFRLNVLNALIATPPFTRRVESKLNNLTLVERMWSMMR